MVYYDKVKEVTNMIIRSFFGLSENPFPLDNIDLLKHQQEIYETLKVHSQQGGFCLIMGDSGTGKTVIKDFISHQADKRISVISVARTLHTYTNTIKILCNSFNIDSHGSHFKCEKRLIEQAYNLYREGKSLVITIDDAHLMDFNTLRKLRLLLEDFPKNHNIILFGKTPLLFNLSLKHNDDIKSRTTYSVVMPRLNPDDIEQFILSQLDKVSLGHNTFSEEALSLIIRSSDGIIRLARNLCLACLLDAARTNKKVVDLDIVNFVLLQPHWRLEKDMELV